MTSHHWRENILHQYGENNNNNGNNNINNQNK
jgi:hypothetical protein